ncbi:hypothetical protein [Pedobacter sp. FW305-3-2-15-E-R2A2]|uniref:hypothetical protein n=1 Tax=Pedobacter sp. FW305-3-2-15-E-R2A2 TaxID=3140251 RepID=UPI0031406B39
MKTMIKIITFCMIALSISACSKKVNPPPPPDLGFEAFSYPRTSWAPGLVFRIKDGEDIPWEVTTLKPSRFDTGFVFLPTTYQKKFKKGGGFLKFLFLNPTDTTIKANYNKEVSVSTKIGQGLSESINNDEIDRLVQNSNINWKDNNRYFIIQSTLSAKQIDYKFQNKSGAEFAMKMQKKAIDGGAGLHWNNVDSTVLNQVFDRNYRIYYKAMQINAMGSASSSTKIYTIKPTKVSVKD